MSWEPNVVGGVDAPKRLYHGTSLANARRIIRTGLEIPEAKPSIVEDSHGVYMAPDWWVAQAMAPAGVVLVVKVKGLPLVYCRTLIGAKKVDTYVSLDPIKAGRVVKVLDMDKAVVWRRK